MHGGERGVRLLGSELAKRCKSEVAAFYGAGDFLQRADFRRR